ncbi:helix-turn-helix domain-containing protein [Myxococcus sp. K38C18041901]|uniref:helix-turn-helix domain-containing protein n=1 Tax=Myxococcus guangdongensis TaxID=2906760 RepID=UPI0020A7B503|nr:helix-turn-helix domain-containing protein [Myxococcus guangdongensis]MCP3065428.1 helix-turn-helix domain-containing protein [Myxococcus guangdongensis]
MNQAELEALFRRIIREEIGAALAGTEQELLSIAEAAALIRGGERTIQGWFRDGSLKRRGKGRKVLVSRKELMAALEREPGALSASEVDARADHLLGRVG